MWNSFRQLIEQFAPIQEDDFEKARPFFKELRLAKGDFFIKEGEVSHRLGYLQQGILRSYYISEKGTDTTYCFCTDHHMECSFKSFLQQQPSRLSIQAMEEATLLVIEKNDLNKLFANSLFWSNVGRVLTEYEYLKMELHASEIKTENAKEKYLRLQKEHPVLIRKVPLHYIASYLGITGRHLTRLRKELQAEGL
jgi:CRP-like cAMP-binding protein